MKKLSASEYARLAAQHSLRPKPGVFRQERIDRLRPYGVVDEETFAKHILSVLSAADTGCARIAAGREYYANDRLNTIVILNMDQLERSTAFHNDDEQLDPSDRLQIAVTEDEINTGRDFTVRQGGFEALEQDRTAEARRKIKP